MLPSDDAINQSRFFPPANALIERGVWLDPVNAGTWSAKTSWVVAEVLR